MSVRRCGNPFSAERLRPGVFSFLFENDLKVDTLHRRLRHAAWRSQVIGPHGTGKSGLLLELLKLAEQERPVKLVRVLPADKPKPRSIVAPPAGLLIVDGFEQYSWLQRRRIFGKCRHQRCGLLVSAHSDIGLPTLHRTTATLSLAKTLVARLMQGWPTCIQDADIQAAYGRHALNLRDMLFQLYDVYEARRDQITSTESRSIRI